jgi:hypothetical protein
MTTATPETEAGTPVVFVSRSPNQVLTRRSVRDRPDGFGGKERFTFEEHIAQQEDRNEQRLARGEEPLPIDDAPWKVEFSNHIYEAKHPVIIEWLRNHDKFNLTKVPSGFYEEPPAAVDPIAAAAEAMKRINAAAEMDSLEDSVAELSAVIAEEKASDEPRPAIVEVAEATIEAKLATSELEAGADPQDGDPPSTSQP